MGMCGCQDRRTLSTGGIYNPQGYCGSLSGTNQKWGIFHLTYVSGQESLPLNILNIHITKYPKNIACKNFLIPQRYTIKMTKQWGENNNPHNNIMGELLLI
jgi:hypothetical protein